MSTLPANRPADWRVRIGVPVGTALLRLMALTWRFEARGDAPWRARHAAHQGMVMAAWHGHLLPFTIYLRHLGMAVLVSEHRDGEVIAQVLEHLGFTMIRGSSTRGGARALVEMIKVLRSGVAVCITPDGPKGPARKFAPGAVVAAQRAGVPITTMFVTADRAWSLNSWDGFMIPKPFARIVLHFGQPTFTREGTPADAAEDAPRFEALLAAQEPVARA